MLGSFRQVRAVFFILKSAALRLALVLAMAGVIPASEAAMAELISDVSRGVFSPGRAGKPVDAAVCASSHSGDRHVPQTPPDTECGSSKFTNRTFSVCRPPASTPMTAYEVTCGDECSDIKVRSFSCLRHA